MMIREISSLYQSGTEFRIGPCRGTQFRFFPSTLRNSNSPILKVEAQ